MATQAPYLLAVFRERADEPGIGVLGWPDGSVDVTDMPTWFVGDHSRWDQNYVKPNFVTTRSVTFFIPAPDKRMPGKPEWLQNVDRQLPQTEVRQTVELDPHQFREDLPALFCTYDFVTKSWWVDETSPGWIFPGEGWSPQWNALNPRP